MKKWIVFIAICLCSCRENAPESRSKKPLDTLGISHSPEYEIARPAYDNARFRNVTVRKQNDSVFQIKGEAQIFEASFSWVIEDGHNELKKGFETTDAGAPEWGKFDFTVSAEKPENGSLTLLLFETSAKDGSRQHELPIPLQ